MITFTVERPELTKNVALSADKTIFAPEEEINVHYSGVTDWLVDHQTWICVADQGAPSSSYRSGYQKPAAGSGTVTLKAPYQGELYVGGHWATDKDRETYKMRYDGEKGIYYTRLLLKQGYYSYNYTTPTGGTPDSEGSFYQTENRYQALVYYKGATDRTWRLTGYRAVEFR